MKQRRRIYYSAAQRSEIWDRWQAGEPMSSIGRRFDRESSSVFSVISPTGGIRPSFAVSAIEVTVGAVMIYDQPPLQISKPKSNSLQIALGGATADVRGDFLAIGPARSIADESRPIC